LDSSTREAFAGVSALAENAGLLRILTNAACVKGQVAHPAREWQANHRPTLSWNWCSGQANAMRTLESRRKGAT
jgi:hypothetical protein